MNRVPPYLFVQISRKIAEKKAQGIEVISFGIGDPDIPTPDYVIDALGEASQDAPNHRYPESEGLPEFREGVADWYQRRFGVELDPEKEVISLIGAKEGIGHVAFCFLDAGDIALVPDPGYPVYAMGTLFAGGESYMLPLTEENEWLPDLNSIPDDVAGKAKLLWLNYPNNPTGAVADLEYYRKAIEFAEKHDIAIMHDACYTEVAYDGYRPPSFLEAEGAMDVGNRVPLAFQVLQYDRLAYRDGRRQRGYDRCATDHQVEPGFGGPSGRSAHGDRGYEASLRVSR